MSQRYPHEIQDDNTYERRPKSLELQEHVLEQVFLAVVGQLCLAWSADGFAVFVEINFVIVRQIVRQLLLTKAVDDTLVHELLWFGDRGVGLADGVGLAAVVGHFSEFIDAIILIYIHHLALEYANEQPYEKQSQKYTENVESNSFEELGSGVSRKVEPIDVAGFISNPLPVELIVRLVKEVLNVMNMRFIFFYIQ